MAVKMDTLKIIRRDGVMMTTPTPGSAPKAAIGTVNYDDESNRLSRSMTEADREKFRSQIASLKDSLPNCYFCVSVDEDEETGSQRLMVRCIDDRRSVERSRDLARILPDLGIRSRDLLVIS